MTDPNTEVEDLQAFRLRARAWLAEKMPLQSEGPGWIADDTERWQHHRSLQRTLFDGGFAGLCFPKEYGGQGLTPAHQRAFDDETAGYQMPVLLNVPTFGIIGATLLDFGSEEQKKRYLPAMLRGDEVWVQFLSEPTGGSDLASVMTRATPTPDGDAFLLSGSKIWSSGAYAADYAICIARTDWDVPKHQGISVFIVQVHQPGITIDRIRGVGGGDDGFGVFLEAGDALEVAGLDLLEVVHRVKPAGHEGVGQCLVDAGQGGQRGDGVGHLVVEGQRLDLFAIDIDLPAEQPRGEAGVLAALADGQRKLILGDGDLDSLF